MKNTELVAPSIYYYPNRIGRLYLEALAELLGESGLNALLNLLELKHFIGSLPPDDLERAFNFADFSNLNMGLEIAYGPRGGQRLANQSGRLAFARGLKLFGPLVGVTDLAFRVLPLSTKIKIGLPLLARIFNQFSDQITRVESFTDHHLYYIDRNPVCWGRSSEEPICHTAVGVLQEGLHWASGGDEFQVEEIACSAMGAESCVFKIVPTPLI